jgi:hypothetical protein
MMGPTSANMAPCGRSPFFHTPTRRIAPKQQLLLELAHALGLPLLLEGELLEPIATHLCGGQHLGATHQPLQPPVLERVPTTCEQQHAQSSIDSISGPRARIRTRFGAGAAFAVSPTRGRTPKPDANPCRDARARSLRGSSIVAHLGRPPACGRSWAQCWALPVKWGRTTASAAARSAPPSTPSPAPLTSCWKPPAHPTSPSSPALQDEDD